MTTQNQNTNPAKSPQQPSPIHLLSVARRARLSELLSSKKDEALKKLATTKTYDSLVRNANLPKPEASFHEEILLMGICGILETFLTDVTTEFLACFPGALKSKEFSLEALAKKGSTSSLLREVAEKEINDLAYKAFPEMLERLQEIFNFMGQLNEQLVNEVNEIKCTRDVYVHGKGKANHIYTRKAGTFARVKLGEQLPLGKSYLESAIDKSEKLINDFFAGGPANYLQFGKVRAFKEMWEATHLNSVMQFDEAWQDGGPVFVGGENIVRPTEKAINWGWSHSEKALFDFFLGIFNSSNKNRTTDTIEALGRFPPSTREGQVIVSWMDSPFWF